MLERASGLWRSVDVTVRYRIDAGAGGVLHGEAGVRGTVGRVDDAAVSAPPQASPIPERTRYEVERRQLLDGLSAP